MVSAWHHSVLSIQIWTLLCVSHCFVKTSKNTAITRRPRETDLTLNWANRRKWPKLTVHYSLCVRFVRSGCEPLNWAAKLSCEAQAAEYLCCGAAQMPCPIPLYASVYIMFLDEQQTHRGMNRCFVLFFLHQVFFFTFVYTIGCRREQASKHRLQNKVQMCTIYEHYDADIQSNCSTRQ